MSVDGSESSNALDGERDRVPAAEAEGGHTRPGVTLLHGAEQRRQDPRSGGADWVPQSHGSSVDIDPRRVQVKLACKGHRGGGEGLVDLV